MTLIAHLKHQCLLHGLDHNSHIVVAYSGGVDSTALLHACSEIRSIFASLSAMYVQHHMHDDDAQWARHCQQFSERLGITCMTAAIEPIARDSSNLECKLRDARHQALSQAIDTPQHVLLMAHHLEDNLATRLKRMLTGAGPIGLIGMRACRPFASGRLIRPCLSLSKQILQNHARQYHCPWLMDPSNLNMRFERNVVEQKLLPMIQTQWPGLVSAMDTMAQKQQLYADMAKDLAISDLHEHMRNPTCIHFDQSRLSLARQWNMLSHWLQQYHDITVGYAKMMSFIQQCHQIRPGRHPALQLNHTTTLRHHLDSLHLHTSSTLNTNPRPWHNLNAPHHISQHKTVITTSGSMRPPHAYETVTVRFRTPGQRIKLHNKAHHQLVKKLLQIWRIPPWERPYIPMIYYNETCACIVGHAICAGFKLDDDSGIAFEIKTLTSPTSSCKQHRQTPEPTHAID